MLTGDPAPKTVSERQNANTAASHIVHFHFPITASSYCSEIFPADIKICFQLYRKNRSV